ncbi:voltage-gated potassium channel KCNC2-like [Tubulanus polymorphus]|uniref:voltage-gated potassium channel KCNC2-like n=1 Tax=Tubulanus polymorphus TaxID=672921 RepID=UPI003DA27396
MKDKRTHRDAQETLAELGEVDKSKHDDDDDENDVARRFGIEEEENKLTKWQRWKPIIWSVLEEPYFSKAAMVFAVMSMCFVVLSIAAFCTETAVMFREPTVEGYDKNNLTSVKTILEYTRPVLWLRIIEYITVAYFTIEFVVRVVFSPDKLLFIKSILNWVDLVSIVPFYLQLVAIHFGWETVVKVLQTIKLARIFRMFKLTRHFNGLKVLVHTLKASLRELVLLILILFMGVLIFSSIIYFVEQVDEPKKNVFMNIPVGFWWALVTMTTLGYGDMYPKTFLGYMVGMVCAISGVLVIALPVPVIVNNFALYYTHAQAQAKLPKKQKKILVSAPDVLKNQVTEEEMIEGIPSGSHQGLNSLSDTESSDSGIKEEGPTYHSKCGSGISVIFTDELMETTDQQNVSSTINSHTIPTQYQRHGSYDSNFLRPTVQQAPGRRQSLMPNLVNGQRTRKGSVTAGLYRSKSDRVGIGGAESSVSTRRQSLHPSCSLPDVHG